MRPIWQIILNKEFFEVFRDGRTVFAVIISPLLITPLLFALLGVMLQKQAKESAKETVSVAFVNYDKAPALHSVLKNPDQEQMPLKVQETTKEEAVQLIQQRKIRAAAIFPDDADAALAEARPVEITLLFDKGQQSGQEAAGRLRAFLDKRGQNVVGLRLQENGLSQQLAQPFQTKEEGVPGGSKQGTILLSLFLPYTLALSAILGAVHVANDTVAGEKERGTLETLLVSPASRREIVTGKFLAVVAICMVSGVLSVIGLLWPFYAHLSAFSWMAKEGLTLRPAAIAAMLLVQVPLAVLGAGLLLTVSTFARNQREAQSYLSPVIIFVTVAAMLSLILKADSPLYWAVMPIANAALVLKQALEGILNLPFIGIACATSILYAACAVLFAAYAFQKESILIKA